MSARSQKRRMKSASALALIGGSQAHALFAADRFGAKISQSISLKTPFGEVRDIYLFEAMSSDGSIVKFYLLTRHGIDGYSVSAPFVNYRANIWALKELGVDTIISWSGPGALNPGMEVGRYAIPGDIIDFTKQRPRTFFEHRGLGFIRFNEAFCPETRHALRYALLESDAAYYDEAVYLCAEGPRLETPAEIKIHYSYGADLIGLTLAPEVFLARELEICYGAICYITNYAEGIVDREYRVGELFEGMLNQLEAARVAESLERMPSIIIEALAALSKASERSCSCRLAMERYRRRGDIGDDWRDWIKPPKTDR